MRYILIVLALIVISSCISESPVVPDRNTTQATKPPYTKEKPFSALDFMNRPLPKPTPPVESNKSESRK